MSQLDRFLLAFRRDLTRAAPHGLEHFVQLYWNDREAFYRAHDAAWASGRAEPFISLSQVRALNEQLSAKTARRLARRYLESARFREGAEVLKDLRYGLMEDGAGRLELARIELGLGRAAAATQALRQALELDPSLKGEAAPLGAALAEIGDAELATASGRWAQARRLLDLWIRAGSDQAALRVIMTFLTRGQALELQDQQDFHHALDTVLSLCRPPSAYNLFRALARQPIYQGQGDVLRTLCALLYSASDARPPIPEATAMGPLGASAALALAGSDQPQTAIAMLGAQTLAYHKAHHLRPALARLVGREVLKAHPLRYGPEGGGRKIFDVFLFNNELRILQLKLHEMADWVEAFVLVEARQTFTAAPKPLVFQENRDQFAAFADKIVHVVVDQFPDYVRHPWAREYHQRDMGVVGLSGRVREDDLVIISDSDEVISQGALRGFDGEYAPMGMERMRYFLNYRQALRPDRLREYPSVWRARYLRSIGLSNARETVRAEKKAQRISPAGWHFTSVSDAPGIAEKLNNTSHQEFAGVSQESVAAALAELRAGRIEEGWERCELDDQFPAYLRAHPDEFEDMLL